MRYNAHNETTGLNHSKPITNGGNRIRHVLQYMARKDGIHRFVPEWEGDAIIPRIIEVHPYSVRKNRDRVAMSPLVPDVEYDLARHISAKEPVDEPLAEGFLH